jgi:hypothetical protein
LIKSAEVNPARRSLSLLTSGRLQNRIQNPEEETMVYTYDYLRQMIHKIQNGPNASTSAVAIGEWMDKWPEEELLAPLPPEISVVVEYLEQNAGRQVSTRMGPPILLEEIC